VASYVVCPQCGTRIKAGRAHCLRCLADLPAPDAPVRLPVWVSLGLSQQQQVTLGVVASVIVMALVAIIWQTTPGAVDDVPRPAPEAAAAPPPRPATQPTEEEVAQPAPAVVPAASPSALATSVDANRRGAAAYASGNFEAARAAYEEALANKPDDAETLNSLGQVLVRMNRVQDAIPRFERAITLVADKSTYHFNLGFAVAQLNQWDKAVAEYREALKLFPTDYAAQYNLATALQKKGDVQGSIPEFEKAIALAPGEPSFHLSLGMALERVGRTTDAVREYKAYLSMDPIGPDAGRLKEHVEALSARSGAKPSTASE
jgi:Flp pilus assembly protein TadD